MMDGACSAQAFICCFALSTTAAIHVALFVFPG